MMEMNVNRYCSSRQNCDGTWGHVNGRITITLMANISVEIMSGVEMKLVTASTLYNQTFERQCYL